MKRTVCALLALLVALTLLPAFSFAEEAEAEAGGPGYLVKVEDGQAVNAKITAGNNTYIAGDGDVVKFMFIQASDPWINIVLDRGVDTGEYPIMAMKMSNTGGRADSGDIYYNEPGKGAEAGKSKGYTWQETTDWQWLMIDFSGLGTIGYLRYDVFDTADVSVTGMLAAVAFFRSTEEAQAYADSDAGKALGSNASDKTIEELKQEEESKTIFLYDKGSRLDTGWWFNPYTEGKSILISLETEKWFDRIWMYVYCAAEPVPFILTIMDENEDEVVRLQSEYAGNGELEIPLGVAVKPGYIEILIESIELDDDELIERAQNWHFVLGSAEANEDLDVEISGLGAATNSNTMAAPAIRLLTCDPDPNYTEKPTATPRPTAAPTNVPTSVPSSVPTEEATEPVETTPVSGSSSNGLGAGAIAAIVCGAIVVISAAVIIISAVSKKKKG